MRPPCSQLLSPPTVSPPLPPTLCTLVAPTHPHQTLLRQNSTLLRSGCVTHAAKILQLNNCISCYRRVCSLCVVRNNLLVFLQFSCKCMITLVRRVQSYYQRGGCPWHPASNLLRGLPLPSPRRRGSFSFQMSYRLLLSSCQSVSKSYFFKSTVNTVNSVTTVNLVLHTHIMFL